MKVLYRPSGSQLTLDEAMERVEEFSSLDEMLDFLMKKHSLNGTPAFTKRQIYISDHGYDARIDWQTYIITVSRYFNEDYMKMYHCPQAIGFCTFKE